MVVESRESSRGTKTCTFAQGTFSSACGQHVQNVHHEAHECLRVIELEREEIRRVVLSFAWSLSGVLEVKYDLDKTALKN